MDDDDADLGHVTRKSLEKIERIRASEGSERRKFADALGEICFLLDLDERWDTAAWFGRLTYALRDLDLGRIDPMLVPKKIDTRPPDATFVWHIRAEVAAAAEALIGDFVITRKEAAEEIAKLFPDLQHIAKPGASLFSSIESWRNEFRKGRVKSPGAQESYLATLRRLSFATDPDDLRRRIHISLECAAESCTVFPHSSP
jgi:hypothetical protein